MKKANLRLMGFLCPRIKHRIKNTIGFYQWFLISLIVNLFVSCQALAQEVKVQQMPLAATVSINDFKETSTLLKSDGDSSDKQQDTTFQEKIVPLKIGDKIPDELWDLPLQVVNHPEGKEIVTLRENKDKLIILDFWATWCAPCIKNFPKLQALQTEFGNKIKIIAVTRESEAVIDRFFKIGVGKEHRYVQSVINDSIVSSYFPHKGVPHIAWISPGSRVLNTTQAEDISRENIQAILDDEKPQMTTKIDIDRNKPLFLSDHFDESMELKSYSIFAKGGYSGLPSGGSFRKNDIGKVYGRQMTNLPMLDIYYPIIYDIFKNNNERFNLKRTILNVKQPELLTWILKNENSYERFNLYNYELIVSQDRADSLYFYMLEDLNRHSDYYAIIQKREIDCLVLVRTSKNDKIKTKGGRRRNTFPSTPSIVSNTKISSMIIRLNGEKLIKLPIIDETGYTDNVDIEVSGVTDLLRLREELNEYDLDLIQVKRKLNMFVIQDKI